eukprot:TRINITY_DN13824_c0_g1_i1.p1 TRINITY_DN13824_c0_g1~~TRINITY_DN13824_c0_g1_i1.p1  ORF type:complete len:559 (-),score=85.09 TRINITY_DN13824_c0_g1_i1:265-1941(-)
MSQPSNPKCRVSIKNTFLDVDELSDDDFSTNFRRGATAPPVLQDPAYVCMENLAPCSSSTSGDVDMNRTLLESVAQKCKAWASAVPGSSMVLPTLEKEATLMAINNMALSVTLADPTLPDCPLIGCSEGFEELTGYSRAEVLGKNCRFLNLGLDIDEQIRGRMREATQGGSEFLGVVPNIRKNRSLFQNLLHLTSLSVREQVYVVGIQSDASGLQIDMQNSHHKKVLEVIAKTIFTENLNAWVQMQARDYYMRLPVPCADILQLGFPNYLSNEQSRFVKIRSAASTATESIPTTAKGEDTSDLTTSMAQEEPEPQPVAAKSAGSAGHPDSCKECTFFFFSAAGCRSGADCTFCHEFHPRKNTKKNRRIMRTLQTRNEVVIEETTGEQEEAKVSMEKPSSGIHSAGLAANDRDGIGRESVVSLSYCKDGAMHDVSGPPLSLYAIAGVRTCLSPHIQYPNSEARMCLEPTLVFVVQPALPLGLSMDTRTGLITGVPLDASQMGVHVVTIKVPAHGSGGISLGEVPLASCKLAIKILPLSSLTVTGVDQDCGVPLLTRSGM